MVGYMQGSKKARNTPSITNNTKIFGIMGGLAPRVGLSNAGTYNHLVIKGGRGLPQLYGKSINYQRNFLLTHKLLSVNPVGSGGVGKGVLMRQFSQGASAPQGGM